MLQRGLSQTDLAKKLRISQVQVGRYLKGHDFPRMVKFRMLMRVLNCTYEDLMGPAPSAAKLAADIKSVDKEQLLAALKEAGYPPELIEFMRRLHGVKLQEWQIKIIDTAISEGEKKKEGT